MNTTITRYDTDTDTEREVEVEYRYTPVTRGRYYGPPEDCYPDEGGDVEVESATYVDTGERTDLTAAELEDLEIEAAESYGSDRDEDRWHSREDR